MGKKREYTARLRYASGLEEIRVMAVSNFDAVKEAAEELGLSHTTTREMQEEIDVVLSVPHRSGRKRKRSSYSVKEGLRRRGYPV